MRREPVVIVIKEEIVFFCSEQAAAGAVEMLKLLLRLHNVEALWKTSLG